jgi:FAD/FMN-containing dehydrogenase
MSQHTREPLHGWGRHPVIEASTRAGEDLARLTEGATLSRGLGRAYGDAALPPAGGAGVVVKTPLADRILSFDEDTGVLRAEAGLCLKDLVDLYLPRNFFTPVTPGTQYVTLGGMVASDIHGKNHHVHGTFGNFVRALKLRVADGRVLEVTPEHEPELFWATFGGMGLTGHILEVEVALEKIPSPWIYEETRRFGSLAEVFHHLREDSESWPMTVAWIDTSVGGASRGRGIVMRGRWATPEEAPPEPPKPKRAITVPPWLPSGLMNRFTVRWMNAAYYMLHGAGDKQHVVDPRSYFYILDTLTEWNRGYGKRGFTQYQCVMPSDLQVYDAFLQHFQALGGCSFVTVFKDCGPAGQGHLSFPQQGTSMALDIPITTPEATRRMVKELNAFVLDHGGRVYLAKDAFTDAEDFQRMYPRYEEWSRIRRRWDPEGRLASAQSQRLMGDAASAADLRNAS